jgi:hypothetical protein
MALSQALYPTELRTQPNQIGTLVLGPHRCGTSATARFLSLLLSADLPDTLSPPHESNPTGHWESQEWIILHNEILASYGLVWSSIASLPAEAGLAADRPDFLDHLETILRRNFRESDVFIAKDPRMCRLMPFWRTALRRIGAQPRIVLVVRHPLDSAASLVSRDGFDVRHALLVWLRSVLDAEAATRDLPRIFVRYEELLSDWRTLASRITDTLELPAKLTPRRADEIDGFLDRDLCHWSHDAGSLADFPLLETVYDALLRHCDGSWDSDSRASLDEARSALDQDGMALDWLLDPSATFVRQLKNAAISKLSAIRSIGRGRGAQRGRFVPWMRSF